jgi:hypothetical protein
MIQRLDISLLLCNVRGYHLSAYLNLIKKLYSHSLVLLQDVMIII